MNEQLQETIDLAHRACELGDIETANSLYMKALAEIDRMGQVEIGKLAELLFEMQKFYASTGNKAKARLLAARFRMLAVAYCHSQQSPSSH